MSSGTPSAASTANAGTFPGLAVDPSATIEGQTPSKPGDTAKPTTQAEPLDPVAAADRVVKVITEAVKSAPAVVTAALAAAPYDPVALPADEREHDRAVEWWYFIGHLDAQGVASPERFGFEFTLVRLSLGGGSPNYYAYHSLIDLDGQPPSYTSADRWETGAYTQTEKGFTCQFPASGAQPGTWTFVSKGLETPPRYEIEAGFWKNGRNHALHLAAASARPPLLHGVNGIVDFGGRRMAYYSRSRLDGTGGISVYTRHRKVSGTVWMDHQWGDIQLLNRRWQFAAVQLDDGTDLALYVIETRAGDTTLARFGARVGTGGQTRATDVAFVPQGAVWAGYPIDLAVRSATLGVDLRLKAVLPDQRRVPTGGLQIPILTFWEGVCTVQDAQGASVGRAFLELGGYE